MDQSRLTHQFSKAKACGWIDQSPLVSNVNYADFSTFSVKSVLVDCRTRRNSCKWPLKPHFTGTALSLGPLKGPAGCGKSGFPLSFPPFYFERKVAAKYLSITFDGNVRPGSTSFVIPVATSIQLVPVVRPSNFRVVNMPSDDDTTIQSTNDTNMKSEDGTTVLHLGMLPLSRSDST